ncbi:MAG: phosphatidylserine decarboxylase [Lachnospiraceae bacterium]|nr:phosphatidylserine decarboxylase [Lachnospiraceae bacterium]
MLYKDRDGRIFEGGTSQDVFLRKAYGSRLGREFLKLLGRPFFSKAAGRFLDSRLSCLFIDSFIRNNRIDLREYVPCRYRSFNDCFARRIKPSRRPVCDDPAALISPADGKATAYRIDGNSVFEIKNSAYTVSSMLRDPELAARYEGGTCVIVRLSVDNYHRYCYAASGHKGENIRLDGFFNTVNPIVLDYVDIYSENSREYTVIESETFGKLIQMEVGALLVGRIRNNEGEGEAVKGKEKGCFEFGGSTVVLLLEKDSVRVREDILKNSAEGYETKVLMGERIGTASKA